MIRSRGWKICPGSRFAGPRLATDTLEALTACNGGNNADDIVVVEGCLIFLQIANIFVIQINIYKATQFAFLVVKMLAQSLILACKPRKRFGNSASLQLNRIPLLSILAKGSRDNHFNRHSVSFSAGLQCSSTLSCNPERAAGSIETHIQRVSKTKMESLHLSSTFRNGRRLPRHSSSQNLYEFLIKFGAVFPQHPGGIRSRFSSLY